FACAAPSPAARRDDRRRERVPDPEDSTDAVVVAAAPASGFPEPEGAGSDCVPEDSSCRPIARAAGCAVGAGPSFLGVCLGVSDWPLPPLPPLPPRRRPRRPPGSSSLWDSVWTGSACTIRPRPWQCSHGVENASTSPVPSFLR